MTSKDKPVDITSLPLNQLEQIKAAIEEELEQIIDSQNKLKEATAMHLSAKDSLSVLTEANNGKQILVPLTSSVSV